MTVSLLTVQGVIARALAAGTHDRSRIEKAAALIALGHVEQLDTSTFAVRSQSDPARVYCVTPHGCECIDSQRGHRCKHEWAARILVAAEMAEDRQREQEARQRADADRLALAYASAYRRAA